MTLAVAAPSTPLPNESVVVPVVVLGTDALLAALPATPVQLAHACLRAGFANAIPASWGDELIAAKVLRRLEKLGPGPAIQCSCPVVAHRLLTVGGDLRPAMLAMVPPPVAIARYVRAVSQPAKTRITYVGSCPGANDDSIDIRMRPDALLAMLAERDIALDEQPRVFESILPPDRRRFRSQPGGVPTVDSLWSEAGARSLVEIDGEDLVAELAQELLAGKNVLIDVSARLGCACSGAIAGVPPKHARANVTTLEPPRAASPVVEERTTIDLEMPIPATSRTPVDVMAIAPHATPGRQSLPPASGVLQLGHRISPVRGMPVIPDTRPSRSSGPIMPRPVMGSVPVSRDIEGRSLPRAYVARRRSSPRGIATISIPPEDIEPTPSASAPAVPRASAADIRSPVAAQPAIASPPPSAPPPAPPATVSPAISSPAITPPSPAVATVAQRAALSGRQLFYVIGAVLLLTLSISTVVAVVVSRSISSAPSTAAPR